MVCYSLWLLQLWTGRSHWTDPGWTLLLRPLLHLHPCLTLHPPSLPPAATPLNPSSWLLHSQPMLFLAWTSFMTWSSSLFLSTRSSSWSPAPVTSSCYFSSGTTRKDTIPQISSLVTWRLLTWSCASSASLWLRPTLLTSVDGYLAPTCVILSL